MQISDIWYIRPQDRWPLRQLWFISTALFLIPLARAALAYFNGADLIYICRCLALWSITVGVFGIFLTNRTNLWAENRERLIVGSLASVIGNLSMIGFIFGIPVRGEWTEVVLLPCSLAGMWLAVFLAFEAGHWGRTDKSESWLIACAAAPFGIGTIMGGILLLLNRNRPARHVA